MLPKIIKSQKGSILPVVLLIAMAATVIITPILQSSLISFNGALEIQKRSLEMNNIFNAREYAMKSFVMTYSNQHYANFAGAHEVNNKNIVSKPVSVSCKFIQSPTKKTGYVGDVQFSFQETNGQSVVTRRFSYVDISNYAAYLTGSLGQLVPGELVRKNYPGGGFSIYVQPSPERVNAHATLFPVFLEYMANELAGDQPVNPKWKDFSYYKTNGRWIETILFNGLNRKKSLLLQTDKGVVLRLASNGNSLGDPISISQYVQKVLLQHLYVNEFKGNNLYYFTQNAQISLDSPWKINIQYRYPNRKSPFLARPVNVNFSVLYGTIISKGSINNVPPFAMLEGGNWVWTKNSKTRYGQVEINGLWFCFSDNSQEALSKAMRMYTLNQGPCLIMEDDTPI